MNNTSTIKEVIEHIGIEKSMLKIQLNSVYPVNSKDSLKQSVVIQAKFTELSIVQKYLENLIKEQS